MAMQQLIERAVRLLRQARHAVALTGAGISTPSGIPDFRSANVGLWETSDPMGVASIYAFRENPGRFYRWLRPLALLMRDARPNAAHFALARLEHAGIIRAVISQNIDGLHQKAGSMRVAEVHGHVREAVCLACYRVIPSESYLARFIADGETPLCPACGGVLKPNATLFGEALPAQALAAAIAVARQCDVMLVAGSSLEVAPAADLPYLALERRARLIIINFGETYLDDRADVLIRGDVADALPRIAEAIEASSESTPG